MERTDGYQPVEGSTAREVEAAPPQGGSGAVPCALPELRFAWERLPMPTIGDLTERLFERLILWTLAGGQWERGLWLAQYGGFEAGLDLPSVRVLMYTGRDEFYLSPRATPGMELVARTPRAKELQAELADLVRSDSGRFDFRALLAMALDELKVPA